MISQEYKDPETLEEAGQRLHTIKMQIMEIEYQLGTTTIDKYRNRPNEFPNPEREFRYWKSNAKKARLCRLQEQEEIKQWVRHFLREGSRAIEEALMDNIENRPINRIYGTIVE